MISAAVLLISTLVVGCLAPQVLRRIDPATHDPTLLVIAWVSAVLGVVLAACAIVVVLVHPEHGMTLVPARLLSHDRWHPFAHGAPASVERAAGGLVAMLVAIGAVWVGRELAVMRRRRMRASDAHVAVLRIIGRRDPDRPNVLRVEHEEPVAFAISGHNDLVVATEGVFRLGPDAAAAVIAHERAHLRGRHHALLECTRILSKAMPFVPLFRQAPVALAELVELSADTSAARQCGDDAVYSALTRMASRSGSQVGLAMGDHAIERRLARLSRRVRPRRYPVRQFVLRTGTAMAGVTVPFSVMIVLLHVAVIG